MADTDLGIIRTDTGRFVDKGNRVFNVKHPDFDGGAKGDGSTDDTLAIQAAFDRVPSGAVVYFPRGTYKITDTLSVATSMTITGDGVASVVRQDGSNKAGFSVSVSDVTVRDIKLQGPQFATSQSNERAIYALGGSSSAYINHLRVENCEIINWGRFGIFMEFVEDFFITGNHVEDVLYGGIFGQSVRRGVISGNRVENIPNTGESYGISLTRQGVASLSTHPRSSDVTVDGNVLHNITGKTGLDTHAGERIVFSNNTVRGCYWGINIGPATNGVSPTYAPHACVVTGNVVDSNRESVHVQGMQLAGAGTLTEAASGCIVSGNVFWECGGDNSGSAASNTSRCLDVGATESCVIEGNVFVRPSRQGILLSANNESLVIANNTFVDVWESTGTGNANAIMANGNNNNVLIHGNRFETDPNYTNASFALTASRRSYIGVRTTASTGMDIKVLGNLFDTSGADMLEDTSGTITSLGDRVSAPGSASATGFAGQWASDGSYYYACTGVDTWLRVAIATW